MQIIPYAVVFVLAVIAFLIPAMVPGPKTREWFLVKMLRGDSMFRRVFENADRICASILTLSLGITTLMAAQVRLFRAFPPNGFPVAEAIGLVISTFIGGCAFYLSTIKTSLAVSEKKKIADLEAQDRENQTNHVVDTMLQEKRKRYVTLLAGPANPSARDVLNPETARYQLAVGLQLIYDFFERHVKFESTLRLALYFRKDEDPEFFVRGYSWDGKRQNCFSGKSDEYLRITRWQGFLSQIAECYHSPDGIVIVPNCQEAKKVGTFSYTHVGQSEKIRSMLVFRVNVAGKDPERSWIIYLDTNQDDFFQLSKKPSYQLFLDRVGKRLSFEMLTMELFKRIK